MLTKEQSAHLCAIVNGEADKELGWSLLAYQPTEEDVERILYEYIIQQANLVDLSHILSLEDFPCVPIMLHAMEQWGYYEALRMFCIKNGYVKSYIKVTHAENDDRKKRYAILQLGIRKKYRNYKIEL